MKILIIEDETGLQEVIQESLEKEKFLVETATTYQAALSKIIAFSYDCILLDVMLPDGSGLDILRELKKMEKSGNVIIISAKDDIDDKVNGLNLGADDYLTKPFHLAELTARIKSVLRRKSFDGQNCLSLGNLVLNVDSRSVSVDDKPMPLNRKEFDILNYLLTNSNRLVNKTALAEHVWGDYMDEADDYEFIYSQVKNLRRKLKEHQAQVELRAVYGIGYKLEPA